MAQLEPKDIVSRAYSAANEADWPRANRYLSPAARQAIREAARSAKASLRAIRLGLPSLPKEQRASWSGAVRVFEVLLAPTESFGWQADIAKGSIRSLRITRQVVRRRDATVFFHITWRDGTVDRDCAHLMKCGTQWRISERPTPGRTPVRAKITKLDPAHG